MRDKISNSMLDVILYVIAFLGMFSIMILGFSILMVCLSRGIDKRHREKFTVSLRERKDDSLS